MPNIAHRVVINIAQLHATESELCFCAGVNPVCGLLKGLRWSQLDIPNVPEENPPFLFLTVTFLGLLFEDSFYLGVVSFIFEAIALLLSDIRVIKIFIFERRKQKNFTK